MRSFALISTTALAHVAAALQVIGPVTNLLISNKVLAPDGIPRTTVVAGGSFPGPIITGSPTSTFQITVQNQLRDSTMEMATSIHWHGMFQKNTSYSDGVAMVTQCPIVPDNQFIYAFRAAGQSGTYWYHSHYGVQYCDGLRGPLIIYDSNDPMRHLYDVDNSNTVITLADWWHYSGLIHNDFSYPDATLINGLGRAWVNTTKSPLSVTTVTRGTRYRLRVLNIGCQSMFTFSIDGHDLTVIEADGVTHNPYKVDSLDIFAGQRYSLILHADQPVSNYWIRALPFIDGLNQPQPYAGGINSGILRYLSAPAKEPTSVSTAGSNKFVEYHMVPYGKDVAAPGPPDVNSPDVFKLNLDITLNFTDVEFYINGIKRGLPTVPVLLQIMSGASAQELVPSQQFFALPRNSVVQLSFPGGDPYPDMHHPIHLHGHTFSVIRAASQSSYNFKNPPRRDVVNMGAVGDNTTIRFVTDNAGPWFLHCHIEWHLNASFAAVFVEDTPKGIKDAIKPPTTWNNLCDAWNSFSASGKI